MAIWQVTFYLVTRAAIEKLDGTSALVIGAFRPAGFDPYDENAELPNYWEGQSSKSHEDSVATLLPPRTSWSADALMFGDEQGDGIESWDDDFRVRLDIRQFNEPLARAVVSLAANADLKLVLGETGRLVSPEYPKLAKEISQSRALKFALDPVGKLRMVGRDQE
jgi:hypothetical protein